ncbi:MAG: hypothetical protein WCY82_08475, partial [Desulfotomaculaceae bacterium]
LVESLSGPLWTTTWATGNIRNYQITVSLIRILTLPATWLLLKYGMEPFWVLVVWVLLNGICYIYRLLYANKHNGIPLRPYFKEVLLPVVSVTALSVPLPLLTHHWFSNQTATALLSHSTPAALLPDLLITTLVSLAATGVLIWILGLKPSEKKHIKQALKKP